MADFLVSSKLPPPLLRSGQMHARRSSSAWIGIDYDSVSTHAILASSDAVAKNTEELAVEDDRISAICGKGGRSIVPLPPSVVFAERIDLPPHASDELVRSQLDVRLPIPVEDCLVITGARHGVSPSSVLAYAVKRDDFESFLESFRHRFGFQPERVVPAADVLWRKFASESPSCHGCMIHLHASGASWLLLAGGGRGLEAVVTVPAGDVAAVARNSAILALRQKTPISSFTISGLQADEALAHAIGLASPSLPCDIRLVSSPKDFLARALAEEGAARDLSPIGNFRNVGFLHPAATRRLLARALCAGSFLLSIGVFAVGLASVEYARARKAVALAQGRLTDVSVRLAGRRLPVTGAAALEMARNEFDQRLNPVVESFLDSSLFDSVALPLELALTRNLSFSSVHFDGQRVRFSGKAVSEDDIAIWRRRAKEAGLALAVESTPSEDGTALQFTATQFRPEVIR